MAGYGIKEQSKQGGLLQFTPNEVLDQRDRDKAQKESQKVQSQPGILSLAGHVRHAFTIAVDSKQEIQDEMLRSLRQRNGVYEHDILQGIKKQGGTEIYMMITDVKCRALESYLKDVMLPIGDIPFHLEATPIPEVPMDIAQNAWLQLGKELEAKLMQQGAFDPSMLTPELLKEEGEKLKTELLAQLKEMADDDAKEMTTEINDGFVEGGWYQAVSDMINDLATYPTAFIIGPVYRKKKVLEWTPISGSRLSRINAVDKIVKEYERFDPFDVYPAPSTKDIQKGDLCLRLRLQRQDLVDMKGVDGYNDATIDHVLDLYGKSGFRDFIYSDTEYADQQDRPEETRDPSEWIDGIKFFGKVQGLMLRQWGMTREQVPNPFDEYDVTTLVIGNYVIMARLNHHPLGKRGIYSASYKKKNGTVWGQAPPYLMRDIQDFCNSSARAICNNFAIASGPQVWINTERIPAGTDIQEIFPWKIWPFTNPKTGARGSSDKPMDFYQPVLITGDLMKAYDYFFKQASEITGIPAYTSENLRGAGQALANYEKIITRDGEKKICDVEIGDIVANSYGRHSKVTGVYPQGQRDVFRMRFSNGTHVDCDMEHRWSVKTHHNRKFQTLTLEEILEKGLFRKTKQDERNPKGYRPKWMLPQTSPVEFDKKDVPIDPYTFGLLIGNGDARCRLRLNKLDREIFDKIPYELGKPDISQENSEARCILGIKQTYRNLGLNCLSINKFIPAEYLYNSLDIRMAMFRGMMDTDGCCSKEGYTYYSTSSYQLAKDFRKLVRSIGGSVKKISQEEATNFEINGRKCHREINYRIHFNLPEFDVFILDRKQSRVKYYDNSYTYIAGIEYIGKIDATCISVDAKDSLFLCANFIPTHNTARGLAMLRNDAARGIRAVARNIDEGIIAPSVTEHRLAIIMEDPSKAKGDAKVVARTSEYLVQQEQLEMRRNEFLDRTMNDVDLSIVGVGGRAEMLRENARSLKMNVDKIIPEKEDIVSNMVNSQIEQIVFKLAQALGVSPEEVMAIVQAQPPKEEGGSKQIPVNANSQQGDMALEKMA